MILASAVYRLALSLWVGGIALFTFVVTPVIFRAHGRDAAGKIVGSIFPAYFRYSLALAALVLLARIAAGEAFHGARQWVGTLLVATAILLTCYQAYGLVPRMEQVKRSVTSFGTAPPRGSGPQGIFPAPRDLDGREPRGPPGRGRSRRCLRIAPAVT